MSDVVARPNVLTTLEEKVVPQRTALLIIDMLNDFAHPEGKTAQRAKRPMEQVRSIIPVIGELLSAARASGVLVVHVEHITLANHASDSGPWLDARSRSTYSVTDIAMAGTWGQCVIDELKPVPGDREVHKYRYSGFAGTNLDLLLRSRGIQTVVCTGASTNVCVEATAREAFSHEYYVVLARDACASWDRSLHDATLASAGHRYALICDSCDLVRLWTPNP